MTLDVMSIVWICLAAAAVVASWVVAPWLARLAASVWPLDLDATRVAMAMTVFYRGLAILLGAIFLLSILLHGNR